MADIQLFKIEGYEEAQKKREESENVKGPKANAYSHANTEALVTGKPSIGTAIADTVIDAVPAVALAVAGHAAKNSKEYKGAKLRDYAKNTEYKSMDPDLLTYAEGNIVDPSGPLSRPLYNLYGKPTEKKLQKKAEKTIKKIVGEKAKKGEITKEDAIQLFTRPFDPKTPELQNKLNSVIDEAGDIIMNSMDSLPSAKSVIDENVKMVKSGNNVKTKKVSIPKTDKAVMNAPAVAKTLAAASGTQDALNTFIKFKDMKTPDKGGLKPSSPFFTITELLDGLTNDTWRYNKKEAISAMNNIWDDIMKNGTEEQQKAIVDIYNNTDFNKKSSVIPSLKQVLQLVR